MAETAAFLPKWQPKYFLIFFLAFADT